MTGFETVASALLWLAGLAVLLRWPILTVGLGAALVAWTYSPEAFWLVAGLALLGEWAWRTYGPGEQLLVRCPELAVALTAGLVALLAGGQVAAGALAVLVLSLGWFASTTLAGLGRPGTEPALTPAASVRDLPATGATSGRLGPGTWQVNVGPCPVCDGLMVATGRNEPAPGGGPIFLAHATCVRCGLHLVGLGDATDPEGDVVWIDPPDHRREDIA